MAGFALSELAEIRQQFAGICEEGTGHLLWQHCMLSIAAAFPNPHAGPSWTTSTASSSTVSTLRANIILYPFLDFGKSRDKQCRDNKERICNGMSWRCAIRTSSHSGKGSSGSRAAAN